MWSGELIAATGNSVFSLSVRSAERWPWFVALGQFGADTLLQAPFGRFLTSETALPFLPPTAEDGLAVPQLGWTPTGMHSPFLTPYLPDFGAKAELGVPVFTDEEEGSLFQWRLPLGSV